jgi:hydrogenase/urease accessory protein HupE
LRGASVAVAGIAGSNIDVLLRIRWADGDVTTGVLRSGSEAITVPGVHGGLPLVTVFRRYGALGVEHILSGPDHLLFLLALVLLVRGWRQLTLTITAFTAAHSVSLALAVLGIVHLPAAPVEALIAASIVPVALEALRPPGSESTLLGRAPWLAAFCFGLVHGLGFASALTELGLPRDHLPAALASFNLGVEAGQLAVVALVLLPVRWLQRQPRWVQAVPAYTIAAVAMAWTIERVGACL